MHLKKSERQEIALLLAREYSYREIARVLGRSVGTISDEIRRNSVRKTYDSDKAHHKAYARRKYAKYQGKKIVEHNDLRKEIHARIMDDQSPEAIARRITKREKRLPSISKDAIYRYIRSPYGRRLETHRIFKRQRRRRRRQKSGKLEGRRMIDARPAYINERKRVGDAEGDFIVSGKTGKGILLVVVDRKARTAFLERILPVSIRNMELAFLRIKARCPEWRTMTTDNDLLFAHHRRLERLLGIRIYFCHTYHSWEKGTVENANKVIRRDIPKGGNIANYPSRFIRSLEAKLNRRPMRILGYRTPQEMLDAYRKRVRRNKKRPQKGCSD